MKDSNQDLLQLTRVLLDYYSFDIWPSTPQALTHEWAHQYPIEWIQSAVLEALHQGRYKAISINQILVLWDRRGQVVSHFNSEFEQLICKPLLDQIKDLTSTIATDPHSVGTEDSLSPDAAAGLTLQRKTASQPELSRHSLRQSISTTKNNGFNQYQSPPLRVSQKDSAFLLRQPEPIDPFAPKPIRVFQPQGTLGLNIVQLVEQALDFSGKAPIHQFIPLGGSSEFHEKLKSVADVHL